MPSPHLVAIDFYTDSKYFATELLSVATEPNAIVSQNSLSKHHACNSHKAHNTWNKKTNKCNSFHMTEPNQVPVVDLVPVDFTANEILLSFTRLTEHRGANSPTTRWHRGEEPWSSRWHSLTDDTNTNTDT